MRLQSTCGISVSGELPNEDADKALIDEAVGYLTSAEVKSKDSTGRGAYLFLRAFSRNEIQAILTGVAKKADECAGGSNSKLTNLEYSRMAEIYTNAVFFQSEFFADRYIRDDYIPMSSAPGGRKEKRDVNAAWLFRRFKWKILPELDPALADIPLFYEPQTKGVVAYYSSSRDKIFVGNSFMEDVKRKMQGDVLCTIRHENMHRNLSQTDLAITSTLVEDALGQAVAAIKPRDNRPIKIFRDAIEHEFTHNATNEYINPEGEIVARIADIICYTNTPYSHSAESLDDAHEYVESNLKLLFGKYHPYVSAAILFNIESLIQRDLPQGYPEFLDILHPSEHERTQMTLDAYRFRQGICMAPAKEPVQMCHISPPGEHKMAKQSDK